MHVVITVIIVALLVALLSTFLVQILAYLAAVVTIPSLIAMSLIQSAGLTDPVWYVALHALLGAVVGATIHRWRSPSEWPGLLAGPFVAPFTAARWAMETLFPGRSQLQEAVSRPLGLAIVLFLVLPLLWDVIAWVFSRAFNILPGGPFHCQWC